MKLVYMDMIILTFKIGNHGSFQIQGNKNCIESFNVKKFLIFESKNIKFKPD